MTVEEVAFTSFAESVPAALDAIEAPARLAGQSAILINPNLINASPPPITTPVACCEALIEYVRRHTDASIVVAEGCGDPGVETDELFRMHGYTEMAARQNVELLDLNTAPYDIVKNSACRVFPEFHMPEIASTHFIIAVPVLKAHSLADITGALKGMMGFAPPEHYQRGGHWKKAAFHRHMHEAIRDLNSYRTPDMTVMDASVGMAEYHLGGPECDPPVARILASYDARALDRRAAELLGLDPDTIPHLA